MSRKRTISALIAGFIILSVNPVFSTDKGTSGEEENKQLVELMNEYANEAYFESYGLNNTSKVFVYELDGSLILEAEQSDLTEEEYRILFQSDLLMESAGNQYFMRMNKPAASAEEKIL